MTTATLAVKRPWEVLDRIELRELRERIRNIGLELGFARVGFTDAEPFDRGRAALADWLCCARHADMQYLSAPDRHDARALLPSARSIIVVAAAYCRDENPRRSAVRNRVGRLHAEIARYARGADYHTVLRARLDGFVRAIGELTPHAAQVRLCVDTAPLLEREAAERSGVAFIGKSTMAITPGLGTRTLLAEVITDLELPPDPSQRARCGDCTACLTSCPTGALVAPYQLDSRRCIAYLTIEHKGAIPTELRSALGNRVFGCDVCQDVCPFNRTRHAPGVLRDLEPLDPPRTIDLIDLLLAGSSAHRRRVDGTALRRVTRQQLARNAAVALGNAHDESAIAPLVEALGKHSSALVRAHAAWALGRYRKGATASTATAALGCASEHDNDREVRREALAALS